MTWSRLVFGETETIFIGAGLDQLFEIAPLEVKSAPGS